ncbi:MAG TPA: SH3 domain-containing protein [Candidatus Luteococcus avicola]|nr:SH3 domain-containing protein [Candidatus Luteococcus avicola]
MSTPRRSLSDADLTPEVPTSPRRGVAVPDDAVEIPAAFDGDEGSFATEAPRDLVRTTIAPIAATAALAIVLGAGVFVPSRAAGDLAHSPLEPTSTSDTLDVRTRDGVSRSLVRPAVASATATASASANATASATSEATKTATPKASAKPSATNTTAKASATASASAMKKATAAATASATPTVPALGTITGTRYATSVVNVRALPSSSARKLDTLQVGESISVTDNFMNGFRQVSLNGTSGWVSRDYLARAKPVVATDDSSSSSGSSSSSSRSSTSSTSTKAASTSGSCTVSTSIVNHLTSSTRSVYQAVCANFPYVTSYGGYRAGDSGEHGQGRALDVMISGSSGWAIANWARANASAYGITEVIYSQQIWTTQRASEGWRSMSDRGSTTANHYDHVHLTVG